MTQQLISTGTQANDTTGTSLFSAGQIINSNFTQLFNNAGNALSVLNFGADPTGIADSTAAINAADVAATAVGQALYFPPGTYSINQGTRLTMNGCSWFGAGRNASIIKSAAGTYPSASNMVTCAGHSNLTISRLGFDMSLVTFPAATTCRHILMFSCTNWEIFDCAFTGMQAFNLAVYANGGSNWSIKDNYFNQATPSTNQSQAINIQAATGVHQVSRNIIIGSGIFSGTGGGLFEGNIITGFQFGSGITLGTPPTNIGNYNRAIGNYVFSGGGNPDVNGTYGGGIECWSPYSIIVGNHCVGMMGSGISLGAANCIVSNNECLNNSQSGQPQGGITAYGKLISATAFTASNSIIANNQLGDNQGSPTQRYGYVEFQNIGGSAAISGVSTLNNTTFNNVTANYLFASTTPAGALLGGSLGLNGVSPPSQPTGYGTPTGGAHQSSFAAGSITLPNLAAAVAQLIIELKSYGLIAA